jgi:hypothetical protein
MCYFPIDFQKKNGYLLHLPFLRHVLFSVRFSKKERIFDLFSVKRIFDLFSVRRIFVLFSVRFSKKGRIFALFSVKRIFALLSVRLSKKDGYLLYFPLDFNTLNCPRGQ